MRQNIAFGESWLRSLIKAQAWMMGAETKKDTGNLSDYQCLSFDLGVISLRKSGARGSRTLVQTGKPYAFYTLSHRWGFRAQARPRPPTCALSSKVSPLHRGLQWLVPICLHHRVGLLRNNSVRVMSRPRTWCRDKANLLYFD